MLFPKYLLVAVLLTSLPRAADARKGTNPEDRRAKMLEKFDANGDGQLDKNERAAARQARAEKRGKRGGQAGELGGGTDRGKGDGKRRQRMLQRFDVNKNGELDPEEREAAQVARAQRRRGRGKQGGQGASGGGGRRQRMLERFDANNDGQLDGEEREAARAQKGNCRGQGSQQSGAGEISSSQDVPAARRNPARRDRRFAGRRR